MNLETIKRHFLGTDFLRPNRFKVIFHTNTSKPSIFGSKMDELNKFGTKYSSKITGIDPRLDKVASLFDEGVTSLCKSVSFPFFTFNTISNFVNNKKKSVINEIDFDPVNFIFMVDADNKILKFILEWKEKIIDENHRFYYKDDYKVDIEILLLHLHDAEVAKVTLQDAILVNADPIDLGTENRNMISEISISVQYDSALYETLGFDLDNIEKYKKLDEIKKLDPRGFLKYF